MSAYSFPTSHARTSPRLVYSMSMTLFSGSVVVEGPMTRVAFFSEGAFLTGSGDADRPGELRRRYCQFDQRLNSPFCLGLSVLKACCPSQSL